MKNEQVRTEEQERELDEIMSDLIPGYTAPAKAPVDKRSDKEKDLDEIMEYLR